MSQHATVQTRVGGLLGAALEANLRGRLSHFIAGPDSPAIVLFGAAHRENNHEGDWYGEHAGKWLYAAAKACARSNDAVLQTALRRVADYLLAQQQPDGYLGTYAAARRFMQPQPPKPPSWDGAPSLRTWDVWVHAYLILGLVETHRVLGGETYLAAAQRIGDLCIATFGPGGLDICELGNHHGLSATVLMDAAMTLHAHSGDARYRALAERVLEQADANPALALLRKALAGADAAEIATGKAYQLLWNLVGLTKLSQASGRDDWREAVERLWHSVQTHHLSLGGGPWGGVAHRSREVFNAPGAFSPQGYVETCSTLAWLQLNRELLLASDQPRHADEIERTAYNDLLAAQAPDGENWCYYIFPNGKRIHTTYWRCCKSSGAMALEELPALFCRVDAHGQVTLDLYGASTSQVCFADGGRLELRQTTRYPYTGTIGVQITIDMPRAFTLRLRIPAWAEAAQASVNNRPVDHVQAGAYLSIAREWQTGDVVVLQLPLQPRLQIRRNRNVQESRAPDGSLVQQEVLDDAYVAVTRGPLAFATGLIDGYKTQETVHLPADAGAALQELDWTDVPVLELAPAGRAPLLFQPYFLSGGRSDGSWRITWLSLAGA
ncbi:hypothetical protein DFR29_10824 [Tahibacter aquaticus]|uniref:Beta-L-arabinofuranosidase (Glycosyl hydrolase family 127) n=1 Tax=Tahibacter aquaticus TaxID=520092 RepID=A0A4R6YUW0_9GAMM|nr:beta-L-arabinofuranosidase domain-containing protein [Tahibacter aquaticus]TDR42441.1 hypothetical protein DFR29_10824 [Tahibacter aquaticus]